MRWFFRIPRFLRAPLFFSGVMLLMVSIRFIQALFFEKAAGEDLADVLQALSFACLAAFLAGVAYVTTRPWLKRYGKIGDGVSGFIIIATFLIGCFQSFVGLEKFDAAAGFVLGIISIVGGYILEVGKLEQIIFRARFSNVRTLFETYLYTQDSADVDVVGGIEKFVAGEAETIVEQVRCEVATLLKESFGDDEICSLVKGLAPFDNPPSGESTRAILEAIAAKLPSLA